MPNPWQKLMARAMRRAGRNQARLVKVSLSAVLKSSLKSTLKAKRALRGGTARLNSETLTAVVPKRAPRPGAGKSPGNVSDKGRCIDGRYTGAQGTRVYRLYQPPQALAAPSVLWPLVVMLHGCNQNPDDFARGTRMNRLAAAHGFLVLYPAQSMQHSPRRCWNWFKRIHQGRGRGEPALLAGMVQQVVAVHAIDPLRIYVAGLSAGGAMAAILGNAYPEVFAAVGVHSGLPTAGAHDVGSALAAMQGRAPTHTTSGATPPPTIVFHGDADPTVHPVNGERLFVAATATPIDQTLVAESRVRQANQGRTATRQVHLDAAGHVMAEYWVLHGAGHAWSGGSTQGSFTDANGPDASAEMWRFFSSHSLPPQN